MTPKTKGSSLILGIITISVAVITVAAAYNFLIPKRPAVSDTIEKNVILGREGMGFYAEEFSGPLAIGNSLINVPAFVAIQRALSSRSISLSVVLVPIKARIYEDRMPQLLPAIVNNRYDLFRNELEAKGVHTPNVNSYLLQHPARNSNLPLYFYADTHWTPQTAFDVGEFVAKEITQRVILDTVPPAPTTKTTTAKQISGLKQLLEGSGDGDLIRLSTPDNPARTQIKPLTNMQLTKLESNTTLLEETPPPRIVQTGTSYSIYPALTDGLRHGLQRDVMLNARDGGWYYTLRDYLASKEFQTKPPRVIIWEYPERYLATAFDARDPERMVANTLGWCDKGAKPIGLQTIVSKRTSVTYNLEFDRPISGTYLSLETTASNGTTLTLSNPKDKTKPGNFEGSKLGNALRTQMLLDRMLKVPTRNLRIKLEAATPKARLQAKIKDARICTASLR
jgi:alginate O-acetyltransferase complex protein AlgJ